MLWDDVTSTRMYVTGGFGPSASNEGFTSDYDLPNDTAYAETCASVAFIFWAQRMLNLELDGRYADLLERALYNGALSGLSRDGEHYFYENKLESDGTPPPLGLAPLPLLHDERLAPRRLDRRLLLLDRPGRRRRPPLRRQRRRPRGRRQAGQDHRGEPLPLVRHASASPSTPRRAQRFSLRLRIPAWAEGATATVNGEAVDVATATDRRLPRPHPRLVAAATSSSSTCRCSPRASSPTRRVREDLGRVALRRGPLVYCLEQADNADAPVPQLSLPRDAAIEAAERRDLFDGIVAMTARGRRRSATAGTATSTARRRRKAAPATLTAIPYYLWANREPGPMAVWLREG